MDEQLRDNIDNLNLDHKKCTEIVAHIISTFDQNKLTLIERKFTVTLLQDAISAMVIKDFIIKWKQKNG